MRTLCDPAVRARLDAVGIQLIGFRDLPGILAHHRATAGRAAYGQGEQRGARGAAPEVERRGEAA